MPNNPYSHAHDTAQRATTSSKTDVGHVTRVFDHQRGDKNVLKVKVSVDNEQPITAYIPVSNHGDITVPKVDDKVRISYRKGAYPIVISTLYPVQESIERNGVKNYREGERYVGHPNTDASLLFDEDGNTTLVNSSDMNGGYDGNRTDDVRTHNGNFITQLDEDIFIHANRNKGGSTYGVADIHTGVLQSPSSPQTEYVDLGFFPRQIEFTANLHQNTWNEPYYTVDDSGGNETRGMAVSEGTATLTPFESPSGVNGPLASTSTTDERVEREPYTQQHRRNVTQTIQSQSWFAELGTEYRSYVGDDQVLRLIQGEDELMTEKSRVEGRVNYFDDTGFEFEWFASNESGATYRSSGKPFTVLFKAYT